ncbi:hypothetical protein GCM10025857_02250 [Alicyclobacillus contaminans]|uniref:HAD family hydrolase n=1 Tax=Alicyclobacillus contaminans TaxID=392016 RepID=UPI0004081F4B|nr:HAD family hydrolase [Alicyclobacillus contaminans]GMA48868.1 hypothetical protein GCM10025857_02250 [Alicyclobacillus contaminans]
MAETFRSNSRHDIRAVFLDIDGTLFVDGQLVTSAQEAVSKLKERNIRVALCTGRSTVHTRAIRNTLDIPDAVYFNGGLAVTHTETVYSTPMKPHVVERAIHFSERNRIPMILHTAHRTMIFRPLPQALTPILQAYDYPPLEQTTPETWNGMEEPVYQLNLFMTRDWDTRVQSAFPECLLYRWHDHAVDLQVRGSDKSHGALALLDAWNIPAASALHIGDGGNDVGMFQVLGYSIAMGNARAEVKQHAKWVTTSASEHGVWNAFHQLGII